MNAPRPFPALRTRALASDDPRLEPFVRAQVDATPFHLPQWAEAIEAATGHRCHWLAAERGGVLAGLLPLVEIRSRLFGCGLTSVGFAVGGGILGEGAEPLAAAAVELAGERGCPSIELRGGALPSGWRRVEGAYAGFVRPLPGDEEAVLASIPRKQRAEVRRAIGFGLEARIDKDPADHYRIYSESVRNLGTPVFPRRLFEAVLEKFGAEADILTVRDGGGRALASVLSLYLGGTVYPYYGGGTGAARAARANEFLYYALMRHAVRRGCARFDFGRSKCGTGAFAFKKNWGFEPQPLVYARWGEARDLNPLSPRYRLQVAAWQRLPLWLANRLGPAIARGLG